MSLGHQPIRDSENSAFRVSVKREKTSHELGQFVQLLVCSLYAFSSEVIKWLSVLGGICECMWVWYIYVGVRMCVCTLQCECVYAGLYMHVYPWAFVYVCVCVCVCVLCRAVTLRMEYPTCLAQLPKRGRGAKHKAGAQPAFLTLPFSPWRDAEPGQTELTTTLLAPEGTAHYSTTMAALQVFYSPPPLSPPNHPPIEAFVWHEHRTDKGLRSKSETQERERQLDDLGWCRGGGLV